MPLDLALQRRYQDFKSRGLSLDMTRGKPSPEQLDLSLPMLKDDTYVSPSGDDCRNYGPIEGLKEARELFGAYLGMPPESTYVLGNSSLEIMYRLVGHAFVRALPGSTNSWRDLCAFGYTPTMLCPVPGYDRHHTICKVHGIDMIPVPLTERGPDMRVVRQWVKEPWVVGMWCVPKYSNPAGTSYDPDIIRALAWLKTVEHFRIFWDLAYQGHHLVDEGDELPNMLELCCEAGHEHRAFVLGSTSKMTFASSGLAMLAASEANLAWFREVLFASTIGQDRLSQLRHVRFLKDLDGIKLLMQRHRALIEPKFAAVNEVLSRELGSSNSVRWHMPRGGYFVSLYVPGHASEVVRIAGELGVKLTPAGAAYPYGDADDSHIRIAPTYPSVEEVHVAMEVVALAIRIATAK
jgi:DNA-binding transcriptional MocR family regulator